MPLSISLPKTKNQNGFAMVEVLVTAIIIAIGVSGLGILLIRAIQATQDSAQQSQAMWIVQDYVGRIRANPIGARFGYYDLTERPNCDSEPTSWCADRLKNGTRTNAATCGPQDMATFDNWITVCGTNSETYDSASDFIINPQITSTCELDHIAGRSSNTDTGETDCVLYNVSLTWDVRIESIDEKSLESVTTNTYSLIVEVN